MDIFYETLISREKDLTNLVRALEKEEASLPAGSLRIRRNKYTANYYWRHKVNGEERFEPLSREDALAYEVKFKRRRELQRCLRAESDNLIQLRKLIRRYRVSSAGREDAPSAEELRQFSAGNSGELYPEGLIHRSMAGFMVRSKSELIIADMLFASGLVFAYEKRLDFGGQQRLYPDFTIRRPDDGKTIYWEHFGLTADPDYLYRMEQKLSLYQKNGVTLWDNLICTFDKPDGSFSSAEVNTVIQFFFGPESAVEKASAATPRRLGPPVSGLTPAGLPPAGSPSTKASPAGTSPPTAGPGKSSRGSFGGASPDRALSAH